MTQTERQVTTLEELIEVTTDLSDLMEQENALLKDNRPSAIAPLQAEKAQLASIYASAIRNIAADRTLLADANEALLADLKDVTRRFQASAKSQQALIDGAARASEGVVTAVARAASRQTVSPAYGQTSAASSAVAPIAIDDRG